MQYRVDIIICMCTYVHDLWVMGDVCVCVCVYVCVYVCVCVCVCVWVCYEHLTRTLYGVYLVCQCVHVSVCVCVV